MKRAVESQPSRRERKENVDVERGTDKEDEERPRRQKRGRGAAPAAGGQREPSAAVPELEIVAPEGHRQLLDGSAHLDHHPRPQ